MIAPPGRSKKGSQPSDAAGGVTPEPTETAAGWPIPPVDRDWIVGETQKPHPSKE